jgi:hypothetical protein
MAGIDWTCVLSTLTAGKMSGTVRHIQRPVVRVDDPTKPAEFNPAGFSFSFAGRGEFDRSSPPVLPAIRR